MLLKRRSRKKLISLLIGLLVILSGALTEHYNVPVPQPLAAVTPGMYKVTEVYDGDTIAINMNGKDEKIRMIGVDTPETHDPRKVVQCFGQAASGFTKQLLENKEVRLEADSLSSNRDRYDRLLRYVYTPDGTLVNAELIKQGFGFAYLSFPFDKSEEFRQYQTDARTNNRGLWSSCTPAANDFGGFTSNPAP